MSQDPFQHIRPSGKIPRSVRAWRELVDVARDAQNKRSGLPADPASSTRFFPNLTVNVRNMTGAKMVAGELVKVFSPDSMGATPAGNKLLNAQAVFPAVKPDASTSSFARLLETINPGLVGKAAVLGWIGSGNSTVKNVSRRVPSQRFYAGSAVVGVPYLNTGFWETWNRGFAYVPGIPAPFAGVPFGPPAFRSENGSGVPQFLPGLESFQAVAAEKANGQPLAMIQSRYRQQFRGVLTLQFEVTRTRGPLKDGSTGRTIGYGFPGFTLNSRVESTRVGQVEFLSGTVSTTLNPVWLSRHPIAFTVGEFDSNFATGQLPASYITEIVQVVPFSTFSPSTFNDPTKWVYRWLLNCWLGGADMPAYASGTADVRCIRCTLELMETQRDDSVTLIREPVANPNPPPPTPASIATPGGESESTPFLSPVEGIVSGGLLQVSALGFAQSAFNRLGQASLTTSASSVVGSGAVAV
jgi:hypothetical protein